MYPSHKLLSICLQLIYCSEQCQTFENQYPIADEILNVNPSSFTEMDVRRSRAVVETCKVAEHSEYEKN